MDENANIYMLLLGFRKCRNIPHKVSENIGIFHTSIPFALKAHILHNM